jgi:hypothetical protein
VREDLQMGAVYEIVGEDMLVVEIQVQKVTRK